MKFYAILIVVFFLMQDAVLAQKHLSDTSPWGVAAHPLRTCEWENIDLAFSYVKAAGIKWLREDFCFTRICKPDNRFHFEKYDALIEKAAQYDIHILPILQAYDNELQESGHSDISPIYNHPEEWRKFVRATVERYHDELKYWEIWNEPDGGFWKPCPNAEQYASLLKIAYEEIKQIDAECKVIVGGLCSWNADYMQALYRAGAQGYFDVIAVHPYNDAPDISLQKKREMEEFQAVVRKFETSMPPIWITEFGGSSFESQLMTQHSDFMLQAITYSLRKLGNNKKLSNITIGLAVSPRIPNIAEISLTRNWLPGITLRPIPFNELSKLEPHEVPVLIGGEGLNVDEPLLKPLHKYVERGGLLIGHDKVPFHTVTYQDKNGLWKCEDRAQELYPAWGLHFDAFWKKEYVPISSSVVQTSPDAMKEGLPAVEDIYVDRFLTNENSKKGDIYYPIIQSYSNRRHIGDGMGLYTYRKGNGGILLSTMKLVNGYTREEQASLLCRNALTYLSLGIQKLFWYDLHNDGILIGEREHNFGLLYNDWCPKPAWFAYNRLIKELGTSPQFEQKLMGSDSTIYALLFKREEDKKKVMTIWTSSENSKIMLTYEDGTKKDLTLKKLQVNYIPMDYIVSVEF